MAWTTPRTWIAGEIVTAANMNAHVRDNFKAIGDAWSAYTPTWTCNTTNPVIGNGTIAGRYVEAGKLVHYAIDITMGSTTTYGSGTFYTFTLPSTPLAGKAIAGHAICHDASAIARHFLGAFFFGGANGILLASTTTAFVSPTSPFTFANTDVISISGTYEKA